MQEVAEKVIYEGMKTYTSYVSKSRVLPYLDGLKPVFRRVIYAMMKVGARSKMLKSSNILGESIKLHPHGSTSVYGAMQTLVCSPNSLITGKGNWGNGIYSPYMAAERYTEARLSPVFEELIDPYFENLGEFVPTYDESSIEPRIIEFRLPIAELIGVYGIGVALTTDCPALHIDTVIDKVLSQLDQREVKTKFAYGSWLYKDKIIPQFEIEDDGKKSWLVITSIPTSKYLDPITENTFIRELCASGQLIIDDQSQKTKGIVKFRVSGPSDTLQTIINKLSFRPLENFVYYDNRIRHSGYYENWVSHRLEYIQRIFYFKQIKDINRQTIHLALSKIHSRLETESVKGREGFLSLVSEVGDSIFQEYENFLAPYRQYCESWKLERDNFLSSLKSTSISSLKSYDIPDFQWHTYTMSECKDYLMDDISKINRKLFSSSTKVVKSIPELPEEVKITRYVTLRGNQVEVRFKRIPRMTNWTTDSKIIVIFEDGTQKDLPTSFFGLYDDPNKKVVGFTFPNTVTVFVTDTKIHAYVRFSKVTEIIKSAFPCKKIKINGTDYKVSGGKSWPLGQWSVVEP